MKKVIEIIANISAFNGLSPGQLEEVRQIAVKRDFTKGEPVFFEGDRGNGFYIVIDGLIKVFKLAPDGKEQILHIIGPGEPFGSGRVCGADDFPPMQKRWLTAAYCFSPGMTLWTSSPATRRWP